MSGIKQGLATELSRLRDPREHSPNCSDDDVCGYCNDLAQALLPVVEREIAAAEARGRDHGYAEGHFPECADSFERARAQAWDFGYACGLGDYGKGDGETYSANPYRAVLSPDPERGEGEGK